MSGWVNGWIDDGWMERWRSVFRSAVASAEILVNIFSAWKSFKADAVYRRSWRCV